MRVVLDTSVLVSAARSRLGASFAIVSAIPSKDFEICLSMGLFVEWQAVLTRPENLPPRITAQDAIEFVRYLASQAHLQDIHYLWRPMLPDASDDMVLELAIAANCEYIITHNVRDFDQAVRFGIKAVTPGQFLALIRNRT